MLTYTAVRCGYLFHGWTFFFAVFSNSEALEDLYNVIWQCGPSTSCDVSIRGSHVCTERWIRTKLFKSSSSHDLKTDHLVRYFSEQ